MPRRISDVIGVSHEALSKEGAFDGFADIDAQFHIDPHLLQSATTPELLCSHWRLEEYFGKVIHLLDASNKKGDVFHRRAAEMLQFSELHKVNLGYAQGGSAGKGIGQGLALKITDTASQIVAAGIRDPIIFELVGLFEEGIGADRISDMCVRIILPDILVFTERVAANLPVQTQQLIHDSRSYDVPYDPATGDSIILIPYEILRNLPVSLDWEDIDVVSAYNEALRNKVNTIIGNTWRKARKKVSKAELKSVLLEHPDLISDLIDQYRTKTNKQYDFARDPAGELVWADIARQFADKYPLQSIGGVLATSGIVDVVLTICSNFKHLIEDNGLNHLLYDDFKQLRHERFAQLLFYGIADCYCQANDLDISREPNAGNGPVDFKVSVGYKLRVNVEVKYTSNPKLVQGFSTQLPIYDKAEKTFHSIYLVIRTTQSDKSMKTMLECRDKAKSQGTRVPDVVLIDGRIKPSASKR